MGDISELLTLKREDEKALRVKYGIPIWVDLPCAFDTLTGVAEGMPRCPFLNLLSILANGDVSFCGLGYAHPEWRMGNILKDDIRHIWRSHPLLLRTRASLPSQLRGVCGECLFRNTCLGKCRANVIAQCGDLLAPDPHCQELYARELFPITRLRRLPDEGLEAETSRTLSETRLLIPKDDVAVL